MQAAENLIRKQFLIYPGQIEKIERLAKREKTSAAEMVRKAIDAYNPDLPADMGNRELMDLVAAKLKEAIADTADTRRRMHEALDKLGISEE
jgi:non-homologous end joining protein Ku